MFRVHIQRAQGPSYVPLQLSRGAVDVISEICLVSQARENRKNVVDRRILTGPRNVLQEGAW